MKKSSEVHEPRGLAVRSVRWDIYEEHLDEAAFLWDRWERSLDSPLYGLADVMDEEERLRAHLEALVLGGAPVAERLLILALESDEPTRISSAAHALVSGAPGSGSEAVYECLRTGDEKLVAAIRRALQLVDGDRLPGWLPRLLRAAEPPLRAVAVDLLSAHGALEDGAVAEALLGEEAPEIAAAGARAALRLGTPLSTRAVQTLLQAPDALRRDAAITVGLAQKHKAAWESCRRSASEPEAGLSRLLLALGGHDADLASLQALTEKPALRKDALWALGFTGRLASADLCLRLMEDAPVARVAAEAFCAITGLRLEGKYVEDAPEQEEEASPYEPEPSAEELIPGPEDELPFPAAAAIAEWWGEARKGFDPRMRYLRGRPFGVESLIAALEEEPMRRRHVWALDVMLRSGGALQLATRSWARSQRATIEEVRRQASLLQRPFTSSLTA